MPSKGEIYAGIRPATREVVTEIAQIRGVTASLIDNLDSLDFSFPGIVVMRSFLILIGSHNNLLL